MNIEHDGLRPRVDPTARIAPNAALCGDVIVGPNTSIGFGAVVTAESGPVRIGRNCVIMENAVLRGTKRDPLLVGDNVLVGPHVYLVGCTLEDDVFVATGACVFNSARVGARARIRIHAIVHARCVLPEAASLPIGWIAIGDPPDLMPPSDGERQLHALKDLDFIRHVFGVDTTSEHPNPMPEAMRRYTQRLAGHQTDRIIASQRETT